MSSYEAFFALELNLTHPANEVYETLRFKTGKHPNEPYDHLLARILAYAHSYRPGQKFTELFSHPKEPVITAYDAIGRLSLWVDLGSPNKKRLQTALRQGGPSDQGPTEYRLYLYAEEQAEAVRKLRVSREKWLDDFGIYRIDDNLMAGLREVELPGPSWDISFLDDSIFLTIGGTSFESGFEKV